MHANTKAIAIPRNAHQTAGFNAADADAGAAVAGLACRLALLLAVLLLLPTSVESAGGAQATASSADDEAEQARAREQAVEEDPLTGQQEQALQEATTAPPDVPAREPNELDFYASLRMRYRTGEIDGWSDGGSRAGVQGRYQFLPRRWLFARAEAGFNLLDELEGLFDPGASDPSGGRSSSFFRRLLNVGYESPELFVVVGKTWSTYYKITSFTDRFFGTGGKASGTYNAGTDGGYTGTGRAERALQTRLLFDYLPERFGVTPFSLNIQVQEGREIPGAGGARYGVALGLSALLATRDNFSFGIAYNHARVPDLDRPALRDAGIDGDARALAVGARWFDDDAYFGTVVTRLLDHETTDQGHYFDGWGWEVFGQYRVGGNWWLTGGWNWLRPDSDQLQAGDYRVKYAVAGVRYELEGFDRVLYLNHRAERSRSESGAGQGNVTTLGLRWRF